MAAKNKPYEQFGPYILFKKLESDSLGELWRAAKVEGSHLGPLVALRRFTGGNRDAIAACAAAASRVVPLLNGTSFVKQQTLESIDGTAALVHEYVGGRSLRHIMEKGRGGTGVQPNPMPIDQAIVVAEKVALSLATTAELKFDGNRLTHGSLIPPFVWITDDGEIRVAGQQLGAGLLASMKDARVASEYGRYFAPESVASGVQSKSADSYALGALLLLLVTGVEPPDATNASAFTQAVRAAKTTAGAPLPNEIRAILDKSLTLDPAARAPIADLKQAISALSGKYAATTFNLAFYVSTLLKKEFEGEALDRDRESKVNLAPFIEAPATPPSRVDTPASAASPAPPMFAAAEASKTKSKAPLAIAAVVILAAVGGGTFFMLRPKPAAPAPAPSVQKAAAVPTATAPPPIVSQPLVAAVPATTATTATTDTAAAEAAQKQAFEAAVQAKLQAEMLKLQSDYTKKLQQTQSKQAPVQVATTSSAPAPVPVAAPARADEPSAAQLDQQRMAARTESAQTQTVAPQGSVTQTQPPIPPPAVAAAPAVREGDIVDLASLDTAPHVIRHGALVYPPLALRQKVEATVFVTVLVSENGDVLDAKILKGDPRFGFNDAAMRAVKNSRFAPAMKEGKRVKVWFPVPVQFKQQ